jgi:PRTRC genetic system protein C
MTATANSLDRRFRFGVTTLADPDPSLPPLEALRLHAKSYPFLQSAVLGEPMVEGDLLVYPVQKPTVQTKGARKKSAPQTAATLDEILAWGQETATVDPSQPARWKGVAAMTARCAAATTNPLIDSLLIPMA